MKTIEIEKLEEISGGGFWSGLCGGLAVVRGGAAIAVALGATVPGLNVVTGLALVSCGIWAISQA